MKKRSMLLLGIILFLFTMGTSTALEISDNFECNGFGCGTGWTGGWATSGDCVITTLSNPIDAYHFRGQSGCDATRYFDASHSSKINISFYATASSLENGEYCRYYYFDGTTNHELISLTNGEDDGSHDYYEFDVSEYGVATNSGLRVYGGLAGADYCYIDDVLITIEDKPNVIDYVSEVGKITNQTELGVFGTEYEPYDAIKSFLQLTEGGNPINNASCEMDIYYPNSTMWLQNQALIYLDGSDGLYFYNAVAPNVTGIYMIQAKCNYQYQEYWVYEKGDLNNYPIRNLTTGIEEGGSEVNLNDYSDGLYLKTLSGSIGGSKYVVSEYLFNVSNSLDNMTIATIYWMGESEDGKFPMLYQEIWNWTNSSWDRLPNHIQLSGQSDGENPSGVDDMLTNTFIEFNDLIQNDNVRIRLVSVAGSTYKQFDNWLSIRFTSESGIAITEIRGGGEIHITDKGSQILNWINNIWLYLTQIWNKLIGIETQLNQTIEITNQSLVLDTEINQTTHIIDDKLDIINQSMMEGFVEKDAHIQDAYDNLTIQINEFRQNTTSEFEYTNWLISQIQSSTNQSNQDILNFLAQIDIHINNTYENLMNINQSLTSQIETNFNITYWWLEHLDLNINSTKEELQSGLTNLSLQLNASYNDLSFEINAMNNSLWDKMDMAESKTDYAIELIQNLSLEFNQSNQDVLDYLSSMNLNITNNFGEIDSQFNTTWEMINNVSEEINFTPVLEAIEDLSVQVDNNFNTTQNNITEIHNHLDEINGTITTSYNSLNQSITNFENKFDTYIIWLNGTLIEMKIEISNIENMTLIINQSMVWLIEWHNISTEDLNLIVQAPNRCLEGTNWIAWAEVKDRYGNILSPLDDIECNMTTDLWGTSIMGYRYIENKWRYAHSCIPANTLFNWSVNCERT